MISWFLTLPGHDIDFRVNYNNLHDIIVLTVLNNDVQYLFNFLISNIALFYFQTASDNQKLIN